MPDKEIPWTDHLDELRSRMIVCLIFLAAFFTIGLFLNRPLIKLLTWPLRDISAPLYFSSPEEGFMVSMKLALFFALFATIPVILWEIWQFIKPSLDATVHKFVLVLFAVAAALFVSGSVFCYFLVLPPALKYLMSFGTADFKPLLSVGRYSSFVGGMTLAFGVSFNFPLVLIALAKAGIVTAGWLRHQRKVVILGIFILAAVLSPSPDVLSQMLLAVPLLVLFEITILVTAGMEKRKSLTLFTETR